MLNLPNISNLLESIRLTKKKKEDWLNNPKVKYVDQNRLPSLGLFYQNTMNIYVKSPSHSEAIDYTNNFNKDYMLSIKKIIDENVLVTGGKSIDDLMSIDIIYIFLLCVELYNKHPFFIYDTYGKTEIMLDHYILPEIPDGMKYDSNEKCFIFDNGYKFSFPTIGIEMRIIDFLMLENNIEKYGENNDFRFIYFLHKRNSISFSEIKYCLALFNDDMTEIEKFELDQLINKFTKFINPKVNVNGREVKLVELINLNKAFETNQSLLVDNQ